MLEAAALLPAEASLSQAFAVADVAEGGAEVMRALEHSELFAGGSYVHPLFREIVQRSLPPLRRRELARRALAVFTDDPQGAAEFIEAAALEQGAALALLEQAADTAQNAGWPYGAARFRAQAVPYATGETRFRLALDAAKVLQRYNLQAASTLCESVLVLPEPSLEVVSLYTELLAQQGRMAEVEALLMGLSPARRSPRDRWKRRRPSSKRACAQSLRAC